jgi:hypothetical protein
MMEGGRRGWSMVGRFDLMEGTLSRGAILRFVSYTINVATKFPLGLYIWRRAHWWRFGLGGEETSCLEIANLYVAQ